MQIDFYLKKEDNKGVKLLPARSRPSRFLEPNACNTCKLHRQLKIIESYYYLLDISPLIHKI